MNTVEKENLNNLFLYHGNVLGAARTTTMTLKALINAIKLLNCRNGDFMERYAELAAAIRTVQPRVIPLSHILKQFEEEIRPHRNDEPEALRQKAITILKEKLQLYESLAERVAHHGIHLLENGDQIIVHSASSVVTNILLQARQIMQKDFSVIVLQLDPVRTPQVALALSKAEISHLVIPAFNLCHYVNQANKILLGAVSITRDLKVVAPVGTSTTLSLCRFNNIKSYLFANSFHFSHGLGESQNIHREETDVATPRAAYHLTTYSHDLVDLSLIDVLVNEDGIVDNEHILALVKSTEKTLASPKESQVGPTPYKTR